MSGRRSDCKYYFAKPPAQSSAEPVRQLQSDVASGSHSRELNEPPWNPVTHINNRDVIGDTRRFNDRYENSDLADLYDAEREDTFEINASVAERFTIARFPTGPSENDRVQRLPAPIAIREYLDESNLPVSTDTWLSREEIPTSEEILDTDIEVSEVIKGTVSIPPNKVDGPWRSKEDYLETHYELLREDALQPVRETIGRLRTKPWAREDEYGHTVGVYENVHIKTLTFSPRGVAARVTFSLGRSGKRVHWEQSKRLITGSLVALTPEEDKFQTRCTMAVVAARPVSGLEQNPPEIDLFFARPEEFEIDPAQSWIMVEDRTSFFEASRHTLRALQKMMREPFPLSEHLIDLCPRVNAPEYVKCSSRVDLSSIFHETYNIRINETYKDVDILSNWPENPPTELDKTQLRALQRVLTKRLAVVQGPPGTGKTHVSVVALKAILDNMKPGDPPIIVTCQTNHALDQLLRHIAEFEPDFARLGGRSKDQDVIKKRTLFELKQERPVPSVAGGLKGPAIKRMKDLEKTMRVLLAPLGADREFLNHKLLFNLGLLTESQFTSLEKGDIGWVQQSQESKWGDDPLAQWLGKNSWTKVEYGTLDDDVCFEYEEADLEFEQLKEIEAENAIQDEDEIESLKGNQFHLGCKYVGKDVPNMTQAKVQELLKKHQNLWKIHPKFRGSVYNYFLQNVKQTILKAFRSEVRKYKEAADKRMAGRWEEDHLILKTQKIIGMTTTGFSKYRALVASLGARIVLIEEAAETLEAPVTAACIPSLEHLILVGDHQQLRPHCQVKAHEDAPFNLNVSLFERLVKNNVEFDTLRRQRRMVPEIRRLLRPIYGKLVSDHPSMKDSLIRPPIAGMGDTNSFFFTHRWPESKDSQMSACNETEANMVVEFFSYLCQNDHPAENITVLTFYNGQRKLILRKLRESRALQAMCPRPHFKVVTVDSYQGEENDIVLLSLVRSNEQNQIGFLSIGNRVCVALSRAKRGLYLFGDGEQLACESGIWAEVVYMMAGKGNELPKTGPEMRIGYHLPLMCSNHGRTTYVEGPDDFSLVNGGCEMKCQGHLRCGHRCPMRCHPFPHDSISCTQPCSKALGCGHKCSSMCSDEKCHCKTCATKGISSPVRPSISLKQSSGRPHMKSQSSASDCTAWNKFAKGGVHQSDQAARYQANAHYQQQERLNEQLRRVKLEQDMERSVFDSTGSSPVRHGPRELTYSNSTSARTTSDGPPLRQKFTDKFQPGYNPYNPAGASSLLD